MADDEFLSFVNKFKQLKIAGKKKHTCGWNAKLGIYMSHCKFIMKNWMATNMKVIPIIVAARKNAVIIAIVKKIPSIVATIRSVTMIIISSQEDQGPPDCAGMKQGLWIEQLRSHLKNQ